MRAMVAAANVWVVEITDNSSATFEVRAESKEEAEMLAAQNFEALGKPLAGANRNNMAVAVSTSQHRQFDSQPSLEVTQ
jgi:hypothetical protein